MKKFQKIQDFRVPENYFDNLPDTILAKVNAPRTVNWMKYAAAAALLVVSFGIWQFNSFSKFDTLSMDEEVSLYIESQYWTAEDVLTMVDNPDEILDQIIEEEMVYQVDVMEEDVQIWF
ncbi:hypothetical protein [Algoriphagus resistens]|uniref:hypothetical protein n=1 Tax=Algoriphagus resistens TaxID=1750590 RepID=UPI0007168073|nr:hypothetical protein [Algoriphagus resistens]